MSRKVAISYHIILTLLALAMGLGEARAVSYPLVRNFGRSDYNAGPQNWAVAQSGDGTMLFGNSYGLLSYDSRRWQTFANTNNSTVRTVHVDNDNKRIYVGASNDFGFFSPDRRNGSLRYHSLRNTLPDSLMEFSEVWAIHNDGRTVWFRGDFNVFGYDGQMTTVISTPHKITASALIDNVLYLGFINGEFGCVEGRNVRQLSSGSLPPDQRVCAIVPYLGKSIWLCTPFDGIFEYDGTSIHSVQTDLDGFLRDNQLFCATSSGTKVAFGTVNCGVVVKDILTGENSFANIDTGLQNNTVLCASFDIFDNLWLGLDNGIDYVLLSSPMTNLLGVRSSYGSGYTSMMLGGRLYLGTNQGLYSMPFPTAPSPTIPDIKLELKGQVWDIDTIGGDLLVCNDNGLYHKTLRGPFRRVEGVPGSRFALPLRSYPGRVLVSTYENFYLVEHTPGAGMRSLGSVDGYSEAVGNPFEDRSGDIWLTHWLKGIYRLKLDPESMRFTDVSLFNHGNGLPFDGGNSASPLKDETVISTRAGLYTYDRKDSSVRPHDVLTRRLGPIPPSRFYSSPRNDIWAVSTANVIVASTNERGETVIDSVTYRPLGEKLIPGFENLNFLSPTQLVVACQDGFYDVDITPNRKTQVEHNPVFISAIYANQDSLLFRAPFFPDQDVTLEIPHNLNSLKIEFISPAYSTTDAMRYSTYMEPYDSQWSPYMAASTKEYTDLPENDYTFHVRALNRYTGRVTETAIRMSVAPPWFRSPVAYAVYLVLTLALAWGAVRVFRKISSSKAEKIEKEKEKELEEIREASTREALEKDYEIARLKSEQLELDIKHKSGELSSITMNVIRKNEILLDISERLSQLAESVERHIDSQRLIRQIDKIKALIRENISHDDDWRTFTRNFDLVYDDYLKRLLQIHPSLTQSDQRICAYIKMGLSSKEIAPLLNISYRSVEMSRYRIRKKMDLSAETSLSDYLNNF